MPDKVNTVLVVANTSNCQCCLYRYTAEISSPIAEISGQKATTVMTTVAVIRYSE